MKNILKNKAVIAFLLAFCLGTIIVLPGIIAGRGIFSLVADYNLQQIPFNMNINQSLKEGSIFWTWYNELGSNFIGTYSFYNLFSPFNIIGYIFPADFFPYLGGILLILKYAVAGLTSFLFLRRYVKNQNYAIIGSLLYSFSGFQLTNTLFFHFHDVVALFPLLLYSLDNLMYENKRGVFGVIVALLALTNWFFFIGEVIFVIIYFLVKVVTGEYKLTISKFSLILFESIFGTLIATFVLLPSFLFVISNPRLGSDWTLLSMIKYPNFGTYLELLRSVLFAPQTMAYRSFITETNYFSVEAYLPVVGITLMLGYFIKNYKKWDSILLEICALFMAVPILNSSFFLFNTAYYARWLFMPILIMVLMSIKYLDNKMGNINISILLNCLLYIAFIVGTFIYISRSSSSNIIFDKVYFILSIVITLINLFALYLICKVHNPQKKVILLLIGIFIYTGIWGNYMVYIYRQENLGVDQQYLDYLNINKYLDIDNNSRTNSSKSCMFNLGVVGRFNNIKSFNSNINGSNFEFYNSIALFRDVSTEIDVNDKLLNNFLGVKYIITCDDEKVDDSYILKEEALPYKLYYNGSSKEIGFSVRQYISSIDFSKLSYDEKIKALNEKIVLNDDQIKKYGDLFNKDVNFRLNEFRFDKNGFSSKIDSNMETLVIYTIPYDIGFEAIVNGKRVEIEKVDNGFMAIKINSGMNEISFSYKTPGLKYGLYISLIALVIYISYYVYNKKVKFVE